MNQWRQIFDLEKIITVSGFNALPLQSQLMFIQNFIYHNSGHQIINNLENVLKVLEYFKSKKVDEEGHYLKIQTKKDNELLFEQVIIDEIWLCKEATSIFFDKNMFKSEDLINQIKPFKTIYIDIQYPAAPFDTIYSSIVEIKETTKNKHNINIGIFITGIQLLDDKFLNNKLISYIIFDSTIKSIEMSKKIKHKGPFIDCSSLTQITIPSSVTSIGNSAFVGCSSLTQITIPSSVTSIGNFAFCICSSLAQITIPSSVSSIGDGAFSGCSSLTLISFSTPSSVTSFGNYSFSGCSSLRQITIPSSVTSIGDCSFKECSLLTQIEIPSSVTSISFFTFRECSSLTQITIPSSITEIRGGTFSGCSSLTQIIFEIPSSVTSIGNSAFFGYHH